MSKQTKYVTYQGETKTIAEWAQKIGMNKITLGHRIFSLGWSPEKAFTTPINKNLCGGASKNDAELYLNDCEFANLPNTFKSILNGLRVKKYGKHIRAHHRPMFDAWFESEYKPQHESNCTSESIQNEALVGTM